VDLRAQLQFEIWRYQLASLPALMSTCRAMMSTVQSVLRNLKKVSVQPEDITVVLAALLAREAVNLEVVCWDGRDMHLAAVRLERHLDLRFSVPQALLFGPLLRSSPSLESACPAGRLLDLRPLRRLGPGKCAIWRKDILRDRSYDSFYGHGASSLSAPREGEVALIAGLLARRPLVDAKPWQHWLRSKSRAAAAEDARMEIDLTLLPAHSEALLALRGAAGRSGVRLVSPPAVPERGRDPGSGFLKNLGILFLLAVALRLGENSHAVESGFGGALMSSHPLKATSFAERVLYWELEAPPASDWSSRIAFGEL